MAEPNFRPKSFGTFLENVRTSSERGPAPLDAAVWIKALQAFSDRPTLNRRELADVTLLSSAELASAEAELIRREFVTVEGAYLTITSKGRDTLAVIS
jgi:hypothetical protein